MSRVSRVILRAYVHFEAKCETPNIIHMAESGAVLERILAFWYPGTEPVVENLGQLGEILELLINKYDMRSIGPLGKQYLHGYVESETLGVWGLQRIMDGTIWRL
ncbi:hypothetical protein B0H19DRAFT_1257501 [Mycena capillaripes]|nr:hypothetical protein B0H19DRAFT_1257501 [Mycena capillaripes]